MSKTNWLKIIRAALKITSAVLNRKSESDSDESEDAKPSKPKPRR